MGIEAGAGLKRRDQPNAQLEKCRLSQIGACRLVGIAARHRASGTRFVFNVAIKARLAPAFPITAAVIIDSWAIAEKTEKLVARRLRHNPNVSMPHDQVRRLRL